MAFRVFLLAFSRSFPPFLHTCIPPCIPSHIQYSLPVPIPSFYSFQYFPLPFPACFLFYLSILVSSFPPFLLSSSPLSYFHSFFIFSSFFLPNPPFSTFTFYTCLSPYYLSFFSQSLCISPAFSSYH